MTQVVQFRERAFRTAADDLPRWAVLAAIQVFRERGSTNGWDVPECLALARQFSQDEHVGVERHTISRRAERTTPEARLATRQLLQAIAKSVQEIRLELFGSPEVPLKKLEDATTWVEQQAAAQPQQSRRQSERVKSAKRAVALLQSIQPQLQSVANLLGVNVQLKTSVQTLAYQRPRSRVVSRVPVEAGDRPLNILHRGVYAIAQATGFAADAVTSHILMGQDLELRAARGWVRGRSGRLPDGTQVSRSFATMELNVRDVPYAELRSRYNVLRGKWRGKKARGLSESHQWLLRTVERRGGLPATGKWSRKFWEPIHRAACRANHPDASWRTTMMRYRRLQKKLSDAPKLGGR